MLIPQANCESNILQIIYIFPKPLLSIMHTV